MAKDEEIERCPRCNGEKFEVSKDISEKRFCKGKGCGHVWMQTSMLERKYDKLSRNHEGVKAYAREADTIIETLVAEISRADDDGSEITLKQVLEPMVALQESFLAVRQGLLR